MASVNTLLLLLVLILPSSCLATPTSSLFPPVLGNVCELAVNLCGKGRCVATESSTLGYECVCDPGWTQARAPGDQFFSFLPCVIPSCSFNFDCMNAPSAVLDADTKANTSIWDPCSWSACGGGTCNQTSLFTYTCQCKDGYHNLLNSTLFPCYRRCELGMNCLSLDLPVSNTTTPPGSFDDPKPKDDLKSNSTAPPASLSGRVGFDRLISILTILAVLV